MAILSRRTVAVAALAIAMAAGACSSSSPKEAASSASTSPATSSTTTAVSAAKIGHIFLINLENESFDDTWGESSPATYLNGTLRPQGQLLTQYFAIGHASLDNYIAQISGQAPNPATQADCIVYSEFVATGTDDLGQALGSGCVYPASVLTIGDQLFAAKKTWKSYQEDLGKSSVESKTCGHPPIGEPDVTVLARKDGMYATRHNGFVYFHSVIDGPTCANIVGLDQLDADLASVTTTPNLVYITPNLCNDAHDAPCVDGAPGGMVSADRFLAAWVPKILASPAFVRDGMLIVTFDEAELAGDSADSSACCNTPPAPNTEKPGLTGPGGGRVGALVVSVKTTPGSTNDTPYNHYALLCSMEDVFGLDHLGFAGAPGLKCFGTDVYDKK